MENEDALHDAFSTHNLWESSRFFQDPSAHESTLFTPLDFDISSIKLDNPYAPAKPLDRELRLPDLDTFAFGSLPELENVEQSSFSAETEFTDTEDEIWKVALDLGPANNDVVFFTWEAFENSEHVEHASSYMSEAGPKAFDAGLKQKEQVEGKPPAGRVLKSNILLDSLLNLGLGRSSILFSFDRKKRTFVQAISDGRASGFSLASAQSLIKEFIVAGNTFLWLRSFVENTFSSANSIPARVALATSISAILFTFEDHLGKQCKAVKSLLQLQRLFAKPRATLNHVARMVDAVKSAKTNEQLSSVLYNRVQAMEENDQGLLHLSERILRFVAKPSLELVGEWIGIREESTTTSFTENSNFVIVENNEEKDGPVEYAYNANMMPRYIPDEDGRSIFETGNSLRFIKTHHPDHPLASLTKVGVKAPELEWKFGWQDLETISTKAKAYEESLRTAIRDFSTGSQCIGHQSQLNTNAERPEMPSDGNYDKYIQQSKQLFDDPPQDTFRALPDDFYQLLENMLSDRPTNEVSANELFSPPLSITPMLSFGPIIAAQAALVNAVTLRQFFKSHQLRLHLSLQREYHLLGDGVFSSRLASALFDPEYETAERRKGAMRSGVHMGLQLGVRSNWPPASSELRLALMGVLSESYHSSALYFSTITKGSSLGQSGESQARRATDELPGQLNFAIRQLTEPEMEKIMDPDSLYALDFLRLQYVPPSPLNLVITSGALEKYDYIFRFLLRLLRMLFVVSHLPRRYSDVESRQFRNEAHQFVTAISTYVFYTGIQENWEHFESFIDSVQDRIREEDEAGELGRNVREGIDSLKAAHEHCLDSIMFALLLRRRQKKVMVLLEEIFDLILVFSKLKSKAATKADNSKKGFDSVLDLYARFKGKIRVFISVCRGLTGKRGYGKGEGTTEENRMERLLVLLEMNGYYAG
ncbi:hypothetical protein GQ43DRAFT_137118 [Delitschia confertaspora ATCC 74209]|uniref:Spindle pole body component n=1 Tax=Delitschia confertaspora ATCC 74209 TaxID=1513339 RepID=A0A9P4MWH6_9PLEO|nr:hypothetical protein GQ43DRAFT_137118 [Delitschia confertaspora ATCC 74209]